jgi:hypothetical protein
LGLADIDELRQRGVGVFFAADYRLYPPAGVELDPMDVLSLQQGFVFAQFERDLLVARTEAGRRALVQRGYWPWAVAPYGYKRERDGFGVKLVADENEQKVLALMRRCQQRGASAPQITAALDDPGYRNRRGERFEYSAVYAQMRKSGIVEPKARSGSGAKSNRVKPIGNPTIGASASVGVTAVLLRKIHDAERVQPVIAHLIVNQGCRSYQKLAEALNFLEVETPRGGDWHPSSVKNAMATVNMTFTGLLGGAASRDPKPTVEALPSRPKRGERQVVRLRYRLSGNGRGRVQRATPDILFMRDQGVAPDAIARVLRLGAKSVKAVVKRYPRWVIDDPAMIELVLVRHAAGDGARKIARALGLALQQVRRLIALRQVKRRRDPLPPLAEDRRAAILGLRRKGKTGNLCGLRGRYGTGTPADPTVSAAAGSARAGAGTAKPSGTCRRDRRSEERSKAPGGLHPAGRLLFAAILG